MKKRSLLLFTYGLAITLALFNCKKDDEPTDPVAPPQETIDDINNIEMETPTIDPPAAVTVVESQITASAEVAALATGLSGIAASGEVPASITAAAGSVTAALSESEIASLNAVTPEAMAAVAAGGALSPELTAIMNKVAADPALKAYLPVFTLPSVGGTTIGARIGTVELISLIEVSDACLKIGNDAFDAKKAELDANKATQDAAVAAAYQSAIAPLAAAETTCQTGVTSKYAVLRASAAQVAEASLADLESAKAVLGESLYATLKALVIITELGYYSSLNLLEAADKNACTAIRTANLAAAEAARVANLAKVTAAYTTALNAATAARNVALQACHNQGSGI